MIKSWAISSFSLCHRFLRGSRAPLSTDLSTVIVDKGGPLATWVGKGYALAPVSPSGLTQSRAIKA